MTKEQWYPKWLDTLGAFDGNLGSRPYKCY